MAKTVQDYQNNQYTMFSGHPSLREKISQHFSPIFSNVTGDLNPNSNILVTNGAIGALYGAIMNLVQAGDEVLMFQPYYTQYVNHIEFAGASIKTAPMSTTDSGEWQFDFDAFEKQISDRTKLVMITNPHNPSGKLWTEQEIARLTEILDKHPQITVVSDDVYFFLPFDNRKYVSFANYTKSNWDKTINIYSSGKMLNCTGWKIGWAIGPEDLIKQAMFVHEASSFNTNVPGQIALAASMDQAYSEPYEGFNNYLDFTKDVFQKGRDEALRLLENSSTFKFKPTQCESGYFLPVELPENARDLIPDKYFNPNVNYEEDQATIVTQMKFPSDYKEVPLDFAFCRYLAIEKGLSIMPLSNFCLHESPHRVTNMIRIAICKTPDTFENPALIQRFKDL